MCHRYPGIRPSDYYEGLDPYEAFQLDIGMAYKGYLKDKEERNELVYAMMTGVRAIVMSNGGKLKEIPQPDKLVKRKPKTKPDYIPTVNEILATWGAGGKIESGKKK